MQAPPKQRRDYQRQIAWVSDSDLLRVITGSTEQQIKGLTKQAEGKAQKAVGDVKEVLKDAGQK